MSPSPVHVGYLQAVSRSAARARPAAVIEYSSAGPAMPVAPGFPALFAPVLAVALALPLAGLVRIRPIPRGPLLVPAVTAPGIAPVSAAPVAAEPAQRLDLAALAAGLLAAHHNSPLSLARFSLALRRSARTDSTDLCTDCPPNRRRSPLPPHLRPQPRPLALRPLPR